MADLGLGAEERTQFTWPMIWILRRPMMWILRPIMWILRPMMWILRPMMWILRPMMWILAGGHD
eukprot:3081861-Pyramimonas_sp.AAC.1